MTQPDRKTTSIPLYVAGLAIVLCGIATLNTALEDSAFTALTTVLVCLGYVTSMVLRRLNYTARIVELAIVAAALVIYVQLIAGQSLSDVILPSGSLSSPELKLAAMLLWLEVLRSFTLVTDDAVAFSAIPSVVLISLAATSNINPDIMAYFVVYLVLSAFLLTHRPTILKSQLNSSFRMSLGISILALIIGLTVVLPVQSVCRRAFTTAMPEFTRMKDRFGISSYADSQVLRIAQGPISLSKITVMTVRVNAPNNLEQPDYLYWRGRIFDYYTGYEWQISSGYKHVKASDKRRTVDGETIYRFGDIPSDRSRLIEQTVEIRPLESNDAYAASEPVAIFAVQDRLGRNSYNCWKDIHPHKGVTTYTVISQLPISNPAELRKAGTEYDSAIIDQFLQTTTSTRRVGELAKEITERISNPYDKVDAIQRFLGERCTYNLEAPPTPRGVDPVNHFIFTSRTGYCDIFASALVIMCREVGIPARMATGFATGEYDSDSGFYQVREMDRHAWAEVYFPDCGWVPFDPTSFTRETNDTWMGMFGSGLSRLIRNAFGSTSTITLTVMLLAACALVAFSTEALRVKRARQSSAPSRLHAAAVGRFMAIQKTLGVKENYVTPMESVASVDISSEHTRRIASEAAELFGEIRYGTREVVREDIRRLETLQKALRSSMRADRRPRPS